MDTRFALHNIINYFCDILELPEGELPERAQDHLEDILRFAADQNIYHYLATWILEHWQDSVTVEMRDQLRVQLEWNKARNVLLSNEIVELARIFREAGIPLIFLKGSAGLMRGLYPLKCRYLSDIDVLVGESNIDIGHECMISAGYTMEGIRSKRAHHYAPYTHHGRIGEVELHMDPYQFNLLSRNNNSDFWDSSSCKEYHGEELLVPSMRDHIWIMMRSDLLARVCLPRLSDSIELSLIINKGYDVDFDSIYERAKVNNVPYIAKGLFYSTLKYTGIESAPGLNGKPDMLMYDWEKRSNSYRKNNLFNDDQLYTLEKDIMAIRFFTSRSLKHKIGFIIWLLRYNRRKYLVYICKKCGLYPSLRYIKHMLTDS